MTSNSSRSALVTGAGHGIGAAVVERLAADDVRRFLLIDRDAEGLRVLARKLPAQVDAVLVPVDLSDASFTTSLSDALKDFGPLDVLINNAGIATENEPDDFVTWRQVLGVNLDAPFLVTAAALPYLNDEGRIVNVSSILGRAGNVRNTAYCASKHGLLGYTKALALDLALRRITVNAVLPGWVDTPMLQGELAVQASRVGVAVQNVLRNARKQIPLKRFVAPEEVAALVQFLCGVDAAAVTAQSFVIDGGFTCGM